MALQSMTALGSVTLQGASLSITFSEIPQNYRDLVVVTKLVNTTNTRLRFNNDSTINYKFLQMFGNGVSPGSSLSDTDGMPSGGNNQFTIHQIFDYSATDKHKTVLSRRQQFSFVSAAANRWMNTSAINSITFVAIEGTLVAGTRIDLYGRIA
jgi:hypothetical protein